MNLSQLQTMLWLRWRLSRNQWRRGGALNGALMLVFAFVVLALAVTGSIGGAVGGLLGLSQAPPRTTMLVFDALIAAFLMMWLMGLVTELQQSEILDLGRFLHLPVALRDVFLLNYVASLVSFSIAAVFPAMLGLALGLTFGHGPAMLLLFPLVVSFFFMITAWTYCLRGWLATLMANKRRRQAVVMGITLTFILVFQLPNLVMNVWLRPDRNRPVQAEIDPEQQVQQLQKQHQQMAAVFNVTHQVVPLFWLPNGARALSEGHVLPALWGALGMFAIGGWGLARAYRGTVRHYLGNESGNTLVAPVAEVAHEPEKKLLVQRRIPFVPEPAGALALATLRSMSRAPEVKMGLAANMIIFGVIGSGMFLRHNGPAPFEAKPLLACGAVAVTFMGLIQLFFNHFGFDRTGFRALALLPTPRRHILLGKNLALAVLALIVFSFFLVLMSLLAHLRFVDVVTAGFGFLAVFFVMSTLGNLASVLLPYRISAGATKANKMSALTAVMLFLSHLISMLTILPVFLPPLAGMLFAHFYSVPAPLATILSAALLAILTALLYRLTLAPLGRLMERREPKILEAVTQVIE